MFWGSSRQAYGSSGSDDSDFSDNEEEEEEVSTWGRSSRGTARRSSRGHRRQSRNQAPVQSWFNFNLFGSAPPTKQRAPKKDRRSKSRRNKCTPQYSQGWGVILLSFLLVVYLLDFFKLLYHDKPVATISRSNPTTSPTQVKQVLSEHSNIAPPASLDANSDTSANTSASTNYVTQSVVTNDLIKQGVSGAESSTSHTQEKTPSQANANPPQPATAVADAGPPVVLKHPMNRNLEELYVPENTGILSSEEVKRYYRKLAQAYLTTFSSGIYRQMYFDILRRRTYSLTPPGANKGVQSILFQIIDKHVYMMDPYEVPRNSKPFYRSRINQVIWLLSKLAGEGRVKNTEFLMAIHDCVQTVNKNHTYRGAHFQESNPTFTIVSCNFSDNIPFPMWEGSKRRGGGFPKWDEAIREYAEDDIPWTQKQDRAVFRGGNRPSMYFMNKADADSHCHEVGRTRLQYLSKQEPDVLDVSIGGTCGGVRTHLERLEPKEHHKFKYILYAEGNCMWADRTRQQVFGPSAIIKQETPCGQFFEPLMKPLTHYIPTDFFFTDTIDRVKWARQNDEKVQSIVKNAQQFGKNFLTLSGIEAYVEVLLEEYTALLVEPEIKLENGATDVTNKRV